MRFQKHGFFAFIVVALLALGVRVPALHAQDSSVTLTVAVPDFLLSSLSEDLFAQFEADNPGVKVKAVSSGFISFPSPAEGLDAHLKAVEEYVSSADVQFMNTDDLSVEATRAGYFLDLAPLANADTTLNTDDFIPETWQSLQWDTGIWGLPISADVTLLIYDKAAFDKAGLAYPDGNWTLDDLANAATALSEKDSDNKITKPGLAIFSSTGLATLVRSLLGTGLYDANTLPNAPAFSNNPALETLLTSWADLQDQGVLTTQFSGQINEIPLRIMGSFGLSLPGQGTDQPGWSLLPGGKAGLNVQGFTISSGTPHPEQAYALAKYLSNRADMANNFFGATPARRSLVGVDTSNDAGQGGGGFAFRRNSPEVKAAVELALTNALPASELRFMDYLALALTKMKTDGVDARTALQEAEAAAITNLQAAADRRSTTTVAVATVVPDAVLNSGEVALNFGLLSFITPLPNKEQWDQLIQEFIASDPQVRQINLDTGLRQPDEMAGKTDCFYLPLNYVPQVDLNSVLNLDPYLDADTSFDRNDVVGSVLSQVQRDNKTWAMPIDLQPEGLRYNGEQFNRFGVPEPQSSWSIDAFNDALKTLKPTAEDEPPFVSEGAGGTYLLLLIAAYGGLPLDYRTSPPTVNFTDPTNVTAIRQVLDLAKNGYIKYSELAGGGNLIVIRNSDDQAAPPTIYTLSLSGFNFRIRVGGAQEATNDETAYKLTTYPVGSQYAAATYNLGTAYISATTQNADACYRWLSIVACHPELFSAMPARYSLVNDPTIASTWTPDQAVFYTAFAEALRDPNTLVFPSLFAGAGAGNFLLERWLNQAFDNYVLHDGDLDDDLATAETYAKAFQECVATIPPYDPAAQNLQQYFQLYIECARKVDPNTGNLFGGGN